MKKFLALLFTLTLAFVMASCGEDQQSDSQVDTGSNSSIDTTSNAQGDTTSKSTTGKEMTLTLQNISDVPFKSVSISEAGKKKYESLFSGTMKPGDKASIKIKVPTSAEKRQFDLVATDTNGQKITFNVLDLSELTEKGGTISLYISEGGGAMADFQQPYNEPTLTIDSNPTKLKYKVGEKYDPSGFSATYTDEEGVATKIDADDVKFVVSNTVEITAGRAFTTAGKKVVVVQYSGHKQQFELVVE